MQLSKTILLTVLAASSTTLALPASFPDHEAAGDISTPTLLASTIPTTPPSGTGLTTDCKFHTEIHHKLVSVSEFTLKGFYWNKTEAQVLNGISNAGDVKDWSWMEPYVMAGGPGGVVTTGFMAKFTIPGQQKNRFEVDGINVECEPYE